MPPWPTPGRGARHRTFSFAATLQCTGAPVALARKLPSGPPAWGHVAGPLAGGGATGPGARALAAHADSARSARALGRGDEGDRRGAGMTVTVRTSSMPDVT